MSRRKRAEAEQISRINRAWAARHSNAARQKSVRGMIVGPVLLAVGAGALAILAKVLSGL